MLMKKQRIFIRKGLTPMPQWLHHQLSRAFQTKNIRQIHLLNECWFFYHTLYQEELEANASEQGRM
jgi:hypothetical protein